MNVLSRTARRLSGATLIAVCLSAVCLTAAAAPPDGAAPMAGPGGPPHGRDVCEGGFRAPPGVDMPPMGMGPRGPGMEGGGGGRGHGPFGPDLDEGSPPFMRAVHLSEEQQDKVFALTHAAAPGLREQSKAARKAHDALRDFGRSAQFDARTAATLAQAQANADSQVALSRIRLEHDLYLVLTPEQRAQLAERKKERDERPDGAWGPR